jgi:ADP-ribose pyrophosphatase
MKYHIIKEQLVYDGFLKIKKAEIEHDSFHRKDRMRVNRESLEMGCSVGILVFEPKSDMVIFVRQFRYPGRHKQNGWLFEIPAGYVEAEEDPKESARREVEEELGYSTDSFKHLCTFYMSPGVSSERMSLYYTEVTDKDRIYKGGGNDDENEDIEVIKIPIDQLSEKIEAGEITDAKSIIAIQWILLNQFNAN